MPTSDTLHELRIGCSSTPHLAPVGAILIRLDDSDVAGILVEEDKGVTTPAIVDNGNL